MPAARLTDRGVVSVSGAEARDFLDRLVTCGMAAVRPGAPRFGALLTPQGKILADFAIHEDGVGGFLLDTPAPCVPELVKRLTLYRLRAKIVIAGQSSERIVLAGWDGVEPPSGLVAVAPDPRLSQLGWRAVAPAGFEPTGLSPAAEYHAHRIGFGVPEAIHDFPLGDAFPHETLMDQLAGVDFDKGCYVGQEVVSRMQHRGTARTRIVPLAFDDAAPPPGTEVRSGERVLGRTGSAAGARALATIRLDRAAEALADGAAITADGRPARLDKPSWIRFAFPGDPVAPSP